MPTTLAAEQAVLDGVLKAMGGADAAVYERDALPDVLPPAYSEVEVTRRAGGVTRAGGPGALYGVYDVQERTTGKNALQLREHRDRTRLIEGTRVTVAGQVSTPVADEGADPIAPDGGWYVGFRSWSFALFPSS